MFSFHIFPWSNIEKSKFNHLIAYIDLAFFYAHAILPV